ncbi:hypothetical protein GCM10009678_24960 [Actinomadura kijaniata]|uniref:Uncharacterized protein n=1 Tax=Actinomadura namibiensis TaxID=182080 RepID=A0A7W3LP57_ACTNM|nr:hypothetical protein [Actinomadura namibiensis]
MGTDRAGGFHDRAGPPARRRRPQKEDATQTNRQALGRSRDGLTSEPHLTVDGRDLPLALVVTAGNVNDRTAFE